MDRRTPPPRWRLRRSALAASATLAVLAGLVVLLALPIPRDAARTFAVRVWHVPLPDPTPTPAVTVDAATSSMSWRPAARATWQWLPAGALDLTHPVDVYDLPLATTDATTVAAIHNAGAHAVCWLPLGTVGSTDPDVRDLAPGLLGAAVPGHPDQRYLDLRAVDELVPFFSARLDRCWTKGFDGVDAVGLDSYLTSGSGTGFPLGYGDALPLIRRVAELAHQRGLAFGLHAGVTTASRDPLVQDAEPATDFAVVDQCAAVGRGCGAFAPYIEHGKAVLHVEYLADYPGATVVAPGPALDRFCPAATKYGFSTILKDGSGTAPAWRLPCPAGTSPAR